MEELLKQLEEAGANRKEIRDEIIKLIQQQREIEGTQVSFAQVDDGEIKYDGVIVASDFQVASPPFPKTKEEALKILDKYKKTKKGDAKSIAEALQALMKLEEV